MKNNQKWLWAWLSTILLLGVVALSASAGAGTLGSSNFMAETYKVQEIVCNGISNIMYVGYTAPDGQLTYSMRVGASGGGSLTLSVDGHPVSVQVSPDNTIRNYTVVSTGNAGPGHSIAAWGNAIACPSGLLQHVEYAIIGPGPVPPSSDTQPLKP